MPGASLTYDSENPTTIADGESVTITITGGCPPFTWAVSGEGFSFTNAVTVGRTNTLNASGTTCDDAEITVTDILSVDDIVSDINTLLNKSVAFSSEQITNCVTEAVIDISTKSLCYEATEDITTEANTLECSAPSGCIKVHSCIYSNKGLMQIHPRLLQHIMVDDNPGVPVFYYHHHSKIAIWPLPDDVYTITVLFSKVTDDLENIPKGLRIFIPLYCVAYGRLIEGWEDDFEMFIKMYLNSVMAYREDLCRYRQHYVDVKDQFQIPDGD